VSNFVAVDTSSRYLAVAAQKGGRQAQRFVPECAMRHSVILMDVIDEVLSELDLKICECDYLVAVTGPGSFTGIRIGISCIKGFAVAENKRAVGVTAFELLAYNINSDCDYLVAIDAAHGNFYVCGYGADNKENLSPRYMPAEEINSSGKPVYGFEDLPLLNYIRIDAEGCLLPCARAAEGKEAGLTALYVKKSQAEEERELNDRKKV